MKKLYKATVTTSGGREGQTQSDDGVLDLKLSKPKSMGGKGEKHTNPEQLFGAAYSACYGSALMALAKKHKVDIGDFNVTATVTLGTTEEDELQLAVILDSYLPGVDIETGEKLVNEAHEMCPYSRAIKDNVDVTLNLLLDEED